MAHAMSTATRRATTTLTGRKRRTHRMVGAVLLVTFLSILWLGFGMLIAGFDELPWGLVFGGYYLGSAFIILFCLLGAFLHVRHTWVDPEKGHRRRRSWLLNGLAVLLIEGLVTVLLYLPVDLSLLLHGMVNASLAVVGIVVLLVVE